MSQVSDASKKAKSKVIKFPIKNPAEYTFKFFRVPKL